MLREKIFESVCRRLLQENSLDLGKIEFSPQRKDGAPKDEPNTDLEEEILSYLGDAVDAGEILPEEIRDTLASLMKSKKYGAFFHAPDVDLVYRGIGRLPREKVAKWMGVDPTELEDEGEADVNFVMSPAQASNHSSWTKDFDIAEKFSRRGSKTDDPQAYIQDYGYKPSQEVLKIKKEYNDVHNEYFETQGKLHSLKKQNLDDPSGAASRSEEIKELTRELSRIGDISSSLAGKLFDARNEDMKQWKKLQKKQKKKIMSAYLDVIVTARVSENSDNFLDLHDIMKKIKFDPFRGYGVQKEVISLSPVRVSSITWKPASKTRRSAPWSG